MSPELARQALVLLHTQRDHYFPSPVETSETWLRLWEENLEKNFQLAHKWGCVLLLDEADVFLKARDEDIQRDAIVSGE